MNNEQIVARDTRVTRLLGLLGKDPGNLRLRKECVDLAMSMKDFDAVVAASDIALSSASDDPAARFDKATGLMGKKQFRDALDVLRELDLLQTESFGIRFNIALCHYCLSEFDVAVAPLEDCYARGLRDAGLLHLLVTSYHHTARIEDAARLCMSNQEVAVSDATLAGDYALVFLDVDDAGRASRWATTALRLDPKSINGRVTQATLQIARLDVAGATTMLQGVIEDAPQTARAWIGLGSLAMLARDLVNAASLLKRGLELMPGHVGSWHMLGWCQLMQSDVPAAEVSFKRAMDLDRNFAETHGALAAIAAIRGETESARRGIDTALRLDSDCLSARFAESMLVQRAGDPAKAAAIVAEAVSALGGRDQSALSKLLRGMTTKAPTD